MRISIFVSYKKFHPGRVFREGFCKILNSIFVSYKKVPEGSLIFC